MLRRSFLYRMGVITVFLAGRPLLAGAKTLAKRTPQNREKTFFRLSQELTGQDLLDPTYSSKILHVHERLYSRQAVDVVLRQYSQEESLQKLLSNPKAQALCRSVSQHWFGQLNEAYPWTAEERKLMFLNDAIWRTLSLQPMGVPMGFASWVDAGLKQS